MSEHQLVRLKLDKHTFEVAVKPATVEKYRQGKIGINDVLFTDHVFKNFSKAERASGAELGSSFGTEDETECIRRVLDEGQFQLTTQERKEKTEQKRREIVNYFHKYYIDPKLKTPHPVTRIESALDTLKPRIDFDVSAEKQAQDLYKKMVEILPLKKSEVLGTLTIPHKVLGSATGIIHSWCSVLKENYNNAGCVMDVSLVPGDYDTFIHELTKVTKGEFQFEIEGHEAMASTEEEESGKGKGKGKGGKGGKKGKGKK